MRGSWQITRLAGIDISVHWSFLLLLGWVVVSALTGFGLGTAMAEGLFFVALFGCVVLHELGHALAARYFGIETHGITLLPIGGVAQLERIPRVPFQELVIALAGPAVNVVLAILLFPIAGVANSYVPLNSLAWLSSDLLTRLLFVNVALVIFNLIPAFPMDGGRVLRSLLAFGLDYMVATRWAVRIGQVVAILLGLASVYNPMLLLIAAFVFFAAEGELRQAANERRTPAADDIIVATVCPPLRNPSPVSTTHDERHLVHPVIVVWDDSHYPSCR